VTGTILFKTPADSLAVGSLAHVIGQLSIKDISNLRNYAGRYVALQAGYRSGALAEF
jgi:carbonic anhydrase/acetyltransferase-like protein (isoleucine patch superfamily)